MHCTFSRFSRSLRILPAIVLGTVILALSLSAILHSGSGRRDRLYHEPLSDAMAAMHFMNAQRSYPLSDIPDSKYSEAFERAAPVIRLARQRSAGAAADGYIEPPPWTPIGPRNVGGRTIALAVNPLNAEIIFAGAASGGLWRTDTQGEGANAWHYIDTGYPALGVNAIAIDPADTANVYIGTGEVYGKETSIGGLYVRTTRGSYGIGILKSIDGGANWSKSLDWSYDQRRGVLDIVIDPNSTQTVFAGTSEGVYRSQNGGGTWDLVLSVEMAVDIAINPTSSDTVFASCGNLGIPDGSIGIYRSVDGGDTWTELTNGLPDSWTGKTLLDIYAAAPNVIYADVANALSDDDPTDVGLYRSLDSGETWENISTGYSNYNMIASYQGWFSHFVVVNPVDSSKVLVSGVDTYKSAPDTSGKGGGGRIFTRKSYWNHWYYGTTLAGEPEGPPEYSHADHHNFARHPTEPSTVFLATDGGIFKTSNFGETFEGRNGGYQTTQFYGGFTSSLVDSNLAIGGLQDNNTVVYEGTTDWKRVLGGDGGFTGLHATNTDVMIGSSQYGRIYKSNNRFNNYHRVNGVMSGDDVCFVAPFAQAPSDPSIGYAGRTQVWRSTGYAEGWAVPGSAPPLDGNPVLSLSVYANDPDIVWATTVPSGQPAGVYRSTTGGRAWEDITQDLPDRYPVDIIASYWNPDVAFVIFSGFGTPHLYRTEDGGSSWDALGVGQLPDIPTSAFVIDPYNRNYLYLGNDFGVWFSPDGGDTWQPFASGMPTAALVMDLSISRTNWSIRAVTHGLGIWERKLVSAAAAEGDTIPPSFNFGILRNSVLRDYLDLYFAPSEPLPTLPQASVNTQDLPLNTISTVDGNIYVGDYKLAGSGNYLISVYGKDFAGNDSTATYDFAAQLMNGSEGAVLSTRDGGLLVELSPQSIIGTDYIIGYRLEGDGVLGPIIGKSAGSDQRVDLERLPPEEGSLPTYAILPGEKILTRKARLAISYDPRNLGGADPSELGIYRWENGSWSYKESYIDIARHRVEASVLKLGIYRLRLDHNHENRGTLKNSLAQNYPNPFNGATQIRYTLARSTQVELFILNVRGQRVRTLVNSLEGPGSHILSWDGQSDSGQRLATGVYLVMLRVEGRLFTRKALYVR